MFWANSTWKFSRRAAARKMELLGSQSLLGSLNIPGPNSWPYRSSLNPQFHCSSPLGLVAIVFNSPYRPLQHNSHVAGSCLKTQLLETVLQGKSEDWTKTQENKTTAHLPVHFNIHPAKNEASYPPKRHASHDGASKLYVLRPKKRHPTGAKREKLGNDPITINHHPSNPHSHPLLTEHQWKTTRWLGNSKSERLPIW